MACAKPSDCAPCNKCAEAPEPVMPRCNVVLPDGSYELNGQRYRSLSAAARAITGTHWSGPAFFGVKGGRK